MTSVESSSPRCFNSSKHAPHALVHRHQGLGVALVVLSHVERRNGRDSPRRARSCAGSGPTSAGAAPSRPPPPWSADRRISRRLIASLVALGGHELGMHGFVREVEEVGLLRGQGAQPVQRVIGQLVGDVALLRHFFAVHVEAVRIRQVGALPAEAHPLVEARLGLVRLRAHVPLAEEAGLVPGLLQVRGEEHRPFGNRRVVIHDAVPVRVEPGENRCAARAAQRRGDEGVLEMRALPCDAVELRRLQPRLRLEETHARRSDGRR